MSPRSVGRRQAESTAQDLIDRHGIEEPPVPVEEIASHEGLVVVYDQLAAETSAVLIREPSGERVIGINASHSYTRQRFSLAHELGHALLHLDPEPPAGGDAVVDQPLEVMFRDRLASRGSNAKEVDANAFAATLLMPENLVVACLREIFDSTRLDNVQAVVERVARRFEVSPEAMRYRLTNLHLLDPT